MIGLTEKAIKEIQSLKNKDNNIILRVSYVGSGWGGPRFNVSQDESIHNDDVVIEKEGIKLVYKRDYEPYLVGMQIDYYSLLFFKGFQLIGGYSC